MLSPGCDPPSHRPLRTSEADTRRAEAASARLQVLTEREREVLLEVARGLSNATVGRRRYMSEATVKAHVSRLLTKLDIANRVQIAILAHDARLR